MREMEFLRLEEQKPGDPGGFKATVAPVTKQNLETASGRYEQKSDAVNLQNRSWESVFLFKKKYTSVLLGMTI